MESGVCRTAIYRFGARARPDRWLRLTFTIASLPPSAALLAGASSAFTLASSLSPHAHAARAPLRLAAAPRVAHLCAVLESAIFFHGRGITVEMTAEGELDEIAFRWDEKTELLGICERGRRRVSRAVSFFPSSSFFARGFFRLWRVPRCGKG